MVMHSVRFHAHVPASFRYRRYGTASVRTGDHGGWAIAITTPLHKTLSSGAAPWTRRDTLVGVFLVSAAAIVFFVHAPGILIADNHFQFWSEPMSMLRRAFQAWDPTRGTGRTYPEFSPMPQLVVAAMRELGLTPWEVERTWYVFVLATAGLGTQLLMRRLIPGRRLAHLVAGLLYMFNPYSLGFFTPSLLFLHYALVPLAVWCVVSGLTDRRLWRWPALFALTTAFPGVVNVPALVLSYVVLIPVVVALICERATTFRRLLRFTLTSSALLAALSAPALMQLRAGSDFLVINLVSTETVESVSSTSSWSESVRGLGGWILYWRHDGELLRPDASSLLTNPWLSVATFVAPVVAFTVGCWTRWPARRLLLAVMVVSTAVMVGVYPYDDPSPLGRLLQQGYDESITMFGLRSTYKAGAGLQLGVAGLVGYGAAQLLATVRRVWSESGVGRFKLAAHVVGGASATVAATVVVFAAVTASAYPVWAGEIFNRSASTEVIPAYYQAATDWLDDQPGDGRVLILPATTDERYRWGAPSYDIFDSLLERPYVLRLTLQHATPPASDMIDALVDAVYAGETSSRYVADAMSRLGISYVMLRNDVAWEGERSPRPKDLQWLSEQRGLRLAADFGEPGQNVVNPLDRSPTAEMERTLPPVQVFAVRGATGAVRALPDVPPLLVSGDADGLPPLVDESVLTPHRSVAFTGQLDADELADELARGSGLVVTDSNRRRQQLYGHIRSYTLADDDDRRAIVDLYERAGSQSVATFSGVESVTEFPVTKGFGLGERERPGAAFDGDLSTAWLTGSLIPRSGQAIRIDFGESIAPGRVTVSGYVPLGEASRRVTSVAVHTSDGNERLVMLSRQLPSPVSVGYVEIGDETDWIQIELRDSVGEDLAPMGLAELDIEAVEVQELIRTPDDVFRAAETDPRLYGELNNAPIAYRFTRGTLGAPGSESSLNREFRVAGSRSLNLRGGGSLGRGTSDEMLAHLLELDFTPTSDDRFDGDPRRAAAWAFDSRYDTAWAALSSEPAQLGLVDLDGEIRSIDVVLGYGEGMVLPTDVRVSFLNFSISHEIAEPGPCPTARCFHRERFETPYLPLHARGALIELSRRDRVNNGYLFGLEFSVAEVRIDNQSNRPARMRDGCVEGLALVDGESIGLRVTSDLTALRRQGRLEVEACESLLLDAGWHEVRDDGALVLDSLAMETAGFDRSVEPVALPIDAPATRQVTSGNIELVLPGDEPTLVVSGQSYHPGWSAVTDSGLILEPIVRDGLTAFRVPAGVRHLDVRFDQGGLPTARLVFAAGLVLVLVALLIDRRGWLPVALVEPTIAGRRSTAILVLGLGAGLGFLLSGPLGAALVVAAVVVDDRFGDVARPLVGAAAALVALGAAMSVPPLGPPGVISLSYGDARPMANALVQVAIVCVVAALTAAWSRRWSASEPLTGVEG